MKVKKLLPQINGWPLKDFVIFQKINEQKLQAFTIGAMGKRPLTRKEQEEIRKREEEEAAAHVSNDYPIKYRTGMMST